MERFILFVFVCAQGLLGVESERNPPVYDEKSPLVTRIPFVAKCAGDDYELNAKSFLHVYKGVSWKFCGQLCRQFSECIARNYKHQGSICYLVGRSGFLKESSVYVINGFGKCPESQRCMFNSRDYIGANVKILSNIKSPYACQDLCRETSDCAFFSYSMKRRGNGLKCWLKRINLKRIDDDVKAYKGPIPYISGSPTCLTCLGFNTKYAHIPNLEINGKVFIITGTYEECQKQCGYDDRCDLFEYVEATKRCFFKNIKTTATPKPGMSFALRECKYECGTCNIRGVIQKDLKCDNVGNCKCKPNYLDKECNTCEEYHEMDGQGNCKLKSIVG